MKTDNPRWTPENDRRLVGYLKTHTRTQAAAKFGVSKTTIDSRLQVLGVRSNTRVQYTNAERDFIRNHYVVMGPTAIAKRFNRQPQSIEQAARRLDLRTMVPDQPLTFADISYILSHSYADDLDLAVALQRRLTRVVEARVAIKQRRLNHLLLTPKERAKIVALVPRIGFAAAAQKLGHPRKLVAVVAGELGLESALEASASVSPTLSSNGAKRRWTNQDLAMLKQLADAGETVTSIAQALGRTRKAIGLQAIRMDVSVSGWGDIKKNQAKTTAHPRKLLPWSRDEDELLRRLYATSPVTRLSQLTELLPGRSKGAIAIRASTLGVTKSRDIASSRSGVKKTGQYEPLTQEKWCSGPLLTDCDV